MSVIRVKRKEKDFFIAKNEALNNTKLSFKAKGLWAFAMSKPDDWQFQVSNLATASKEKKSAIYSAIKELQDEGYCLAEQKQDSTGRWQSVDYLVFETKGDAEEFKKCLPHSGFPQADFPQADNRTLLRTESSSLRSEELKTNITKSPASPSFSADASFLTDFFLKKIEERMPKFKKPNLNKWCQEMDRLLRLDKRGIEEVKQLITWASTAKWYKANCLSPENLRKQYDRMLAQMLEDSEQTLIRKNRNYALDLKEKYPKELKSLSFDDKYVANRIAGKELKLNMEHKAFKDAFVSMFGGSRG